MKTRAAVLALCIALCSTGLLAQDTIAIPKKPANYVTDRPKVLSAKTRGELEAKLRKFNDDTGNQVVVWIGRTLPADVTIEQYANASFNLWGVGQKEKNNGVLLMLFIKSRKMRIETGDGVRDRLSDARAAEIIEAMKPGLRAGDYDTAIGTATDAVVQALTPPPPPPPKPAKPWPPRRLTTPPEPARDVPFSEVAGGCIAGLLTLGLFIFLGVLFLRWFFRGLVRTFSSRGVSGGPINSMRVNHHHYRSGWGWGGGGWGGSRSNNNTVVNNIRTSGPSWNSGSSNDSSNDSGSSSGGGFSGGGGSSSGGGASGSW